MPAPAVVVAAVTGAADEAVGAQQQHKKCIYRPASKQAQDCSSGDNVFATHSQLIVIQQLSGGGKRSTPTTTTPTTTKLNNK
jgi:hypothetical protein